MAFGRPETEATIKRTTHRASLFGGFTEDPFAYLQFVFGDFSSIGAEGGLIKLIRITKKRYFISWGTIGTGSGSSLKNVTAVFKSGDSTTSIQNWTFGTDTVDLGYKTGTYSYIEFATDQTSKLTARVFGINGVGNSNLSDSVFIEKPSEIIQYLVEWYPKQDATGQLSVLNIIDEFSWYKLKNEEDLRKITLAGVINKDLTLFDYIVEILEYIFFSRIEAGRVYLFSESAVLSRSPAAHINGESEDTSLSFTISLNAIKNLVTVAYGKNWTTNKFDIETTGALDEESVKIYGKRSYQAPWIWGRNESIALDIETYLGARLSKPQMIVSGMTQRHFLSYIQYNDIISVSSTEAPKIDGLDFRNAYCSVKEASLGQNALSVKYKLIFEYWYYKIYKNIGKTGVVRGIVTTNTTITTTFTIGNVIAVVSSVETAVTDASTVLFTNMGVFFKSQTGEGQSTIASITGNTITIATPFTTPLTINTKVFFHSTDVLLPLGFGNTALGGEYSTQIENI